MVRKRSSGVDMNPQRKLLEILDQLEDAHAKITHLGSTVEGLQRIERQLQAVCNLVQARAEQIMVTHEPDTKIHYEQTVTIGKDWYLQQLGLKHQETPKVIRDMGAVCESKVEKVVLHIIVDEFLVTRKYVPASTIARRTGYSESSIRGAASGLRSSGFEKSEWMMDVNSNAWKPIPPTGYKMPE